MSCTQTVAAEQAMDSSNEGMMYLNIHSRMSFVAHAFFLHPANIPPNPEEGESIYTFLFNAAHCIFYNVVYTPI